MISIAARHDGGGCPSLLTPRTGGVVHAVTFNHRGNPLVQEAREMIAAGELGAVHFIHGAYLHRLLEATDYSGA